MSDDPPLARLIHELKSPLTAVKGLAATGSTHYDAMTDEDRQRFFSLIDVEADRLVRVLDQVAEILRLDGGTLEPHPQSVDLEVAIEEAASKVRLGGHHLLVDVADRPARVVADPRLLERTLAEGLDNAARFSPAEGPISVSVDASSEAVRVRIRDEGPGLAEGEWDHAFDLCNEVRPVGYREVAGAGLSLYLARRHLSLIGGTIGLMRDSADTGTILTLEFPREGTT